MHFEVFCTYFIFKLVW